MWNIKTETEPGQPGLSDEHGRRWHKTTTVSVVKGVGREQQLDEVQPCRKADYKPIIIL